MSTRTLRTTLFAVLAAAAITLLPAAAQAAPTGALRGGESGFDREISSLISRIYSLFRSVWGAEGPSLDPDGFRSISAPTGGNLDPDGASVAPGDEGGSLDPDGFTARGDEGGSLDPNG